jgi:ABC-type nitrate/sulfonate/bicarbonate transport system substrate-binding protein
MRKTGWIAIVLLSASSILLPAVTQSAFCAEQPGKPTPVRIGIVSRSTLDMPFYVARERNFFREEGLEAEIILIKANWRCKRSWEAASTSARRRELRSARSSTAPTSGSFWR